MLPFERHITVAVRDGRRHTVVQTQSAEKKRKNLFISYSLISKAPTNNSAKNQKKTIETKCEWGRETNSKGWRLSQDFQNIKTTRAPKRTRPLQHYSQYTDVIMTAMASQITSLAVVYSTVYSDADQRKHKSSASLAFVWGIHRDRWIPRTKDQLRGKCFHLMTSTWQYSEQLYQTRDGTPECFVQP